MCVYVWGSPINFSPQLALLIRKAFFKTQRQKVFFGDFGGFFAFFLADKEFFLSASSKGRERRTGMKSSKPDRGGGDALMRGSGRKAALGENGEVRFVENWGRGFVLRIWKGVRVGGYGMEWGCEKPKAKAKSGIKTCVCYVASIPLSLNSFFCKPSLLPSPTLHPSPSQPPGFGHCSPIRNGPDRDFHPGGNLVWKKGGGGGCLAFGVGMIMVSKPPEKGGKMRGE